MCASAITLYFMIVSYDCRPNYAPVTLNFSHEPKVTYKHSISSGCRSRQDIALHVFHDRMCSLDLQCPCTLSVRSCVARWPAVNVRYQSGNCMDSNLLNESNVIPKLYLTFEVSTSIICMMLKHSYKAFNKLNIRAMNVYTVAETWTGVKSGTGTRTD